MILLSPVTKDIPYLPLYEFDVELFWHMQGKTAFQSFYFV